MKNLSKPSRHAARAVWAALWLVLVPWTGQVWAGLNEPYQYKCDDGRVFTITFFKDPGQEFSNRAELVFATGHKVEELENLGAGSGISYGNGKYIFGEHHDEATLTDFTKPGKRNMAYETPCRVIR